MRFALLVALLPGVGLAAQSPISQAFDVAKPITMKGTVVALVVAKGAHSYLVIDAGTERWAVEGNNGITLLRDGWDVKRGLAPGDTVTVVGFPPKPGTKRENIDPNAGAVVIGLAKNGRLVHGTTVTLSSGKTLAFGATR
jgi:hypothetical protein